MSAVLTPTRRSLRRKIYAYFRSMYLRKLIAASEFDRVHLEADLAELPKKIELRRKLEQQMAVELVLLETT